MFTDAELNRFINTANTALNDAALRILHAIIYEDLYGQLPPNCVFSKVRYCFFDSKYMANILTTRQPGIPGSIALKLYVYKSIT